MDLKHECKHCHQFFESRTQVAKHMYLHKQGHICSHCSKPFASESGLKRHMNANHTQNRSSFKCTICDLSFRLKRDFEKHHLSEHRADKHFECKQCGARFSWLINLTKHEKFHSDQGGINESMNESLNESTKEDSSVIKLYQCEICGKKFNYDFTYAIHLAGHERSTNLITDDLLNTTEESSAAIEASVECAGVQNADESVNKVEGGMVAEVEDRKESDKVVSHIPSEEENKDLFEYLNDCRNRREQKLKLKRKDTVIYDFVMTADKPYKCSQCDEAFRWQVSLDIHLKVHSGKTLKVRKPYLTSKPAIEAMKKKRQESTDTSAKKGVAKNNGDPNVSKIIYHNESDEDNDIFEEEEEEEVKVNKNNEVLDNVVNNAANNNDDNHGNKQKHDDDEDEDDDEGMNAIELLNSIGKPQTINNHDYL